MAKAMGRAMGNEAFLASLLEEFALSLPGRISAMQTAAENGDWRTLGQEAHRLKGAAANLSAEEMSKAAGKLEAAANGKKAFPWPKPWTHWPGK